MTDQFRSRQIRSNPRQSKGSIFPSGTKIPRTRNSRRARMQPSYPPLAATFQQPLFEGHPLPLPRNQHREARDGLPSNARPVGGPTRMRTHASKVLHHPRLAPLLRSARSETREGSASVRKQSHKSALFLGSEGERERERADCSSLAPQQQPRDDDAHARHGA